MRIHREQTNSHQRLVNYEPLVVYGKWKKSGGPSEGTGPPSTPGLPADTDPPDTG